MVDPKKRIIDYYKTEKEIDKITRELLDKAAETQDIVESLTLTAVQLTGMPHGTGISKPVENIQERYSQIVSQYEARAAEINKELSKLFDKHTIYKEWLEKAELNESELKVIEYKYKDGYADWKIAELLPCNPRTVWKIINRAFNKLGKK